LALTAVTSGVTTRLAKGVEGRRFALAYTNPY
jgi:hypothetical protein